MTITLVVHRNRVLTRSPERVVIRLIGWTDLLLSVTDATLLPPALLRAKAAYPRRADFDVVSPRLSRVRYQTSECPFCPSRGVLASRCRDGFGFLFALDRDLPWFGRFQYGDVQPKHTVFVAGLDVIDIEAVG